MSIRLMAHNQQWQQEFDQSRSMLLHATEGWLTDVRHIGSTALPDLLAQPMIDMLACMDDMRGLNEAASLVEGLNYTRLETPAWCQNELAALLHKPRAGEATHTLLIVRRNSAAWRRCLAIHDFLMDDMLERQKFENLKRDNFQPGCAAEQQYKIAKADYFEALELKL